MKIIDLRSDTVTRPTPEMKKAMCDAPLGDDVFGEDPTVNRLEEMAAGKTGKEAALFTPSGTMSNLLSVLSQTRPGDEIILGSEAHILWYEVGGASAVGGVVMRAVPNQPDGTIHLADIKDAIRGSNLHFPPTRLICLENTHNRCGGAVLSPSYTAGVANLARMRGIKVHLGRCPFVQCLCGSGCFSQGTLSGDGYSQFLPFKRAVGTGRITFVF
ncbi:threonine aldolase [Dehalococcoides mccartyi]|nr:threonine aldolase [Dehalococcoides mccartyi]